MPDNPRRALAGLLLISLDVKLGGGGWLVGVGYPGELRDLPGESLLVEALHIPLGAHLERSIDEDLDEVLADIAPHLVTHLLEGRDGADDHTYPVARKEVGHEPYPQDVGVPVLPGETQPLGEVGPHYVPVQNLDPAKAVPELVLDDLGDGGLARPG